MADGDGNELGFVVRTSPIADQILGFSGPTDVLLVFDQQKTLVDAKILSSRDKRAMTSKRRRRIRSFLTHLPDDHVRSFWI